MGRAWRHSPPWPRSPGPGTISFWLLWCALLALAGLPLVSEAGATPFLVVTFLDVGQGDAAWVQTPDAQDVPGQDILVDGGPASGAVRDYLVSHGCSRVEYLILTHPHLDHYGGLTAVVESLPVERLWFGEEGSGASYGAFWSAVSGHGITSETVRAGAVYTIGAATLAILHPTAIVTGTEEKTNNNSLVCRVSYGTVDFLLTGDVQAAGEGVILQAGRPLEAEVLKVAHHGSKYSSTADFLAAASPKVAVISVGASNLYGHPARETLARLAAVGAAVYRTDLYGTVTVTTDGAGLFVQPTRIPRFLFLPLAVR